MFPLQRLVISGRGRADIDLLAGGAGNENLDVRVRERCLK